MTLVVDNQLVGCYFSYLVRSKDKKILMKKLLLGICVSMSIYSADVRAQKLIDVLPGAGSSEPIRLTGWNNLLYFYADNTDTFGKLKAYNPASGAVSTINSGSIY